MRQGSGWECGETADVRAASDERQTAMWTCAGCSMVRAQSAEFALRLLLQCLHVPWSRRTIKVVVLSLRLLLLVLLLCLVRLREYLRGTGVEQLVAAASGSW